MSRLSRPFAHHRPLRLEILEDRAVLAASDYLLEIDGVKGESTAPGHKYAIEISSWSWGVSGQSTGGGGTGKPSIHDISITKSSDSSSAKLAQAANSGKPLKGNVHLSFFGNDPDAKIEYLIYDLSQVFVTSFSSTGAQGNVIPTEEFTLNFAKLKFIYKEHEERRHEFSQPKWDTKGPDLNGDGTKDPIFFNFAPLSDPNHDQVGDFLVARDPDRNGVPNNSLVADLNGDGQADTIPTNLPPPHVAVSLQPYQLPPRLIPADFNHDNHIDQFFAFDVNGDGRADVITSVKPGVTLRGQIGGP